MVKLEKHQIDALRKMKNGCILCGGTGSGKSLTGLGYYYILNGGDELCLISGSMIKPMKRKQDLYIITTARKRDTFEWEGELIKYMMHPDKKLSMHNINIVIDSWNNIKKYKDVKDAFFIFDEQRVVGYGTWAKSFLKIAKNNEWILLSATPGDKWEDYIPVFIANGFYKNKTEFVNEHIVYKYNHGSFPKIDRYLGTGRLLRLRRLILVDMEFDRQTVSNHIDVYTEYDIKQYKDILKFRWNTSTDEPIETASGLCYELRRIVNSDPSREERIKELHKKHEKVIIFYNFDYELEILRNLCEKEKYNYSEWNGHKHQDIPDTKEWVYLVQYTAGAEGWNCTKTNCIIFYSQNYSYKTMVQSAGRIDRLNTPFKDLYFYHIKSRSSIDLAISRALSQKKKFNETRFTVNFSDFKTMKEKKLAA